MVGRTALFTHCHWRSGSPTRRQHRVADAESTEVAGSGCGLANELCLIVRRSVRELAMFAIIGIIVVFGCVVAGYLMEHGNLKVLLQPAELVTIGGAAIGTVLIANP